MIKYKTISTRTQAIDKILCNACGEPCPKPFADNSEYALLQAEWGYGSCKDGEQHEAHVCEKCYDGIIATFKIPPERTGHL